MSDTPELADELSDLIPDLLRLARYLASDRHSADDMAQDVLLNVWVQMANGAEIANLRPYLMTALRNRARQPVRRAIALDSIAEPSHAAEAPARLVARDVMTAMTHLSDAQSVLLSDLALSECSYRELAARHNLPLGTVMSRLARARAALRRELDLDDSHPISGLLRDCA